jgi:hypothetical protein
MLQSKYSLFTDKFLVFRRDLFCRRSIIEKKVFEERIGFQNLLNLGFKDSFRYLYPEKKEYSWILNPALRGLPHANTRLDYFLVSKDLMKEVIDSKIENCVGSDHLPIILEIKKYLEHNDLPLEKIFFPENGQISLF